MANLGLGAGLAALAFWGFIAAVVFAAMWDRIRKRDAEHETIRRMLDSGKPLDSDALDKLLRYSDASSRRPDLDFRVTALWVGPVAVGVALLGVILGLALPEVKMPLLGAAALLACLCLGYWLAAGIVGRWYVDRSG